MEFDVATLPADWQVKALREVTVSTSYRDPGKQPDKTFHYVDVSSVDNTLFKVTNTSELKGLEAPSRARKDIRTNDVIFATVRPTLRRIALIPPELDGAIASTGYCVLRSDKEKVVPRFLYAWLLTDWFVKTIGKLERGANYPAVRDADVFNANIPLPSLDEQRKIAAVLSQVQQAIEQQERLIALTTELKRTLLHQLFTQGLRGEPQKQTEIGLVPESWEVVTIGRTGKVVTGSTPSTKKPEFYGGKYNLISPADLDAGKYITSAHRKLTKQGFGECRALPKDAVLVGCIGNVGKLGLTADEKCATNQQINAIICNEDFNPHFVYYSLQFHRPRLAHAAAKVTVPILNKSNFESFQFAAPKKPIQDEIAGALTILDDKADVLNRKKQTHADLFRTLLHQLMTAQIRVNEMELEA